VIERELDGLRHRRDLLHRQREAAEAALQKALADRRRILLEADLDKTGGEREPVRRLVERLRERKSGDRARRWRRSRYRFRTPDDRNKMAYVLLCAFGAEHNEQLPHSMDELERWVDSEFGARVPHYTVIKGWPELFERIQARRGITCWVEYSKRLAEQRRAATGLATKAAAPSSAIELEIAKLQAENEALRRQADKT
jgi:hypothetical protein